jgi:2-oxoglutarate dehydrogenase complex dehydrogenase (E1) component-like enzyme
MQALARRDGGASTRQEPTGLPLATLQRVGAAICSTPSAFDAHPAVAALLEARRRSIGGANSRVDWALAEALAFGTLMLHK